MSTWQPAKSPVKGLDLFGGLPAPDDHGVLLELVHLAHGQADDDVRDDDRDEHEEDDKEELEDDADLGVVEVLGELELPGHCNQDLDQAEVRMKSSRIL